MPSYPRKEFEIKKTLDRLKGISTYPKDNNNNNDSNGAQPPFRPISPPFIDPRPPPLPPPGPGLSGFNPFQPSPPDLFPSRGRFDPPPPPPLAPSFNNFGNFNFGAQPSSFSRPNVGGQPTSNLFGSQTAILTRQKENIAPQDDVGVQIDDTIYE